MNKGHSSDKATCGGSLSGGRLSLTLAGRLDSATVPNLWNKVRRLTAKAGIRTIDADCSGLDYCDGAGAALLFYIRQTGQRVGAAVEFQGLEPAFAEMLSLYSIDHLPETGTEAGKGGAGDFVEEVGRSFWSMLKGLAEHISFIGELVVGLAKVLIHPAGLRVQDFLLKTEATGPQALPIVGMLGFLIGLIIAFQGAVLMKQFGAEIYIADSVGMLVLRELGPLITAVVVAGRTGSAFAAELGTMKVNEEIDALTTMGLDPVRFLVIPRVAAATLMTPLLAVLADLAGVLGGAVVMLGLGFPLVTYVNRLLEAVSNTDFVGGLVKAAVFGVLIASSGCLCGLRTGEGASAVGNSATRAVVSSIIMIVIADGIFAVLFYKLGI